MVAATASAGVAQAFTDAEVDEMASEILKLRASPGMADAINSLSSELIECAALTTVSAVCLSSVGQQSTAQKTEYISRWTGRLGVVLGSGVGASEKELEIRLGLAAEHVKRDAASCLKLDVLLRRFREICEPLVPNPVVRLKTIFLGKR